MKTISVQDASVLSFMVRHRDASEDQVESVLEKAKPSLRAALRNARSASKGKNWKRKGLGSKTGRHFALKTTKAKRRVAPKALAGG